MAQMMTMGIFPLAASRALKALPHSVLLTATIAAKEGMAHFRDSGFSADATAGFVLTRIKAAAWRTFAKRSPLKKESRTRMVFTLSHRLLSRSSRCVFIVGPPSVLRWISVSMSLISCSRYARCRYGHRAAYSSPECSIASRRVTRERSSLSSGGGGSAELRPLFRAETGDEPGIFFISFVRFRTAEPNALI
jgi:hypothetical protein